MRSRRAAVVLALLVVGAAAVLLVVLGGGSQDARGASSSASTSTKTTAVQRRDIVQTDSEDGTLGYADSRPVLNHRSGTVTQLPQVGSVVRTNHTLYEVDGRATYLLGGATPAYRNLDSAVSDGPDVLELERDLRALHDDRGHAMRVDGSWDSGTTAAVKRWQRRKGLDDSGEITLGQVVFQPGTRRVSALTGTLGASALSGSGTAQTDTSGAPGAVIGSLSGLIGGALGVSEAEAQTPPSGPTGAAGAAPGSPSGAAGSTKTVTVTVPAQPTPTPTGAAGSAGASASVQSRPPGAPQGATSGSAARTGAPSGGAAGQSSAATGGSSSAPSASTSAPIMTTTSTRQIIAVALDTDKQDVAKTGARVSVQLPDSTTVHGRIARVARAATAAAASSQSSSSSSSSGSDSTLKVTVKLRRRVKVLDQAPVTVDFESSRVKGVLAVPVTAILALPGGKFGVEVHRGTQRSVTRVTTGLSASGYVEITGSGLAAGQVVTDSGV